MKDLIELIDALRKSIIVPTKLERICIQKFGNRMQGTKEYIGEYIYELKRLAKMAFGEGNNIDHVIEDQFLSGIHNYIRSALITVEYKNLDELMAKARRIEANYNHKSKEKLIYTIETNKEKDREPAQWGDMKKAYQEHQNNRNDRSYPDQNTRNEKNFPKKENINFHSF